MLNLYKRVKCIFEANCFTAWFFDKSRGGTYAPPRMIGDVMSQRTGASDMLPDLRDFC